MAFGEGNPLLCGHTALVQTARLPDTTAEMEEHDVVVVIECAIDLKSPKRRLSEGDILSIDFGAEMDGYYGDAAVTVPVGKISPDLDRLLQVTRESLDHGIEPPDARQAAGKDPEGTLKLRASHAGSHVILEVGA